MSIVHDLGVSCVSLTFCLSVSSSRGGGGSSPELWARGCDCPISIMDCCREQGSQAKSVPSLPPVMGNIRR